GTALPGLSGNHTRTCLRGRHTAGTKPSQAGIGREVASLRLQAATEAAVDQKRLICSAGIGLLESRHVRWRGAGAVGLPAWRGVAWANTWVKAWISGARVSDSRVNIATVDRPVRSVLCIRTRSVRARTVGTKPATAAEASTWRAFAAAEASARSPAAPESGWERTD